MDEQGKDPLNQRTPDNYGATPIKIEGYKGVLIWKYNPGWPDTYGPAHWTCGWKVTVNGNQYGDWIRITEPSDKVSDKTREGAESVLLEQARESIKRVLEQNEKRS